MGVSLVRLFQPDRLFGGFREARRPDLRKTPDFCLSAMSAMSANCASCVLLADLGNASTPRLVADDLRQGALEDQGVAHPRNVMSYEWEVR